MTISKRPSLNIRRRAKSLAKKMINLPSKIKNSILAYQRTYRNGVEKYGLWWKIFNWSMWGFILVFLFTAVIIFVYYLPLMQRIKHL